MCDVTTGNASSLHQPLGEFHTLAALHRLGTSLPPDFRRQALVFYSRSVISQELLIDSVVKIRGGILSQYSMNFFSTVPVVPSAMISKKEAISPQLKPSANLDSSCSGLVFLEVARRPMRAFATCSTVIMSVGK
jgi:hypothetical protein